MNKTKRATYTTSTILVLLGLLVFASASGAIGRYIPTVTEDTITCTPQKGSSEDLWTCTDYYGNRFKDLQISILIK
jgi:hypothetical protein